MIEKKKKMRNFKFRGKGCRVQNFLCGTISSKNATENHLEKNFQIGLVVLSPVCYWIFTDFNHTNSDNYNFSAKEPYFLSII